MIGKREVSVDFTRGGGRALVGNRRVVRGKIWDTQSGRALTGYIVRLIGRNNGEVVLRRRAVSDAEGRVAMPFKLTRTVRIVLRAPATAVTKTAVSPRAIRWVAVRR